MSGWRYAQFFISVELFTEMVRGGSSPIMPDGKCRIVKSNLPADLRVIHVDWNFALDSVRVVAESGTFDPVSFGSSELPTVTVLAQVEYRDPAELAAEARERIQLIA